MKKLLLVLIVILSLAGAASAQIIPKVTVFGGYTLVRAQQNNGGFNFNLNGWDASAELKPASWLGLVGDVSQQYGTPSGLQEKQTTFLFGPQVSVPGIKRVMPFAHILVGAVHGTNRVIPLGIACPIGSPICSQIGIALGTTLATAVGGGVDFKLAGPLWVRAIQVDYLHANLNPDHHTQMRVAAGLAFHF
ncbi:MAG TPA: hypothetical protein VG028_02615 [Terriglobia bacterium]|nr:hypothetical protein [Terriglobia bacterium]